jgi:hypothetical protein
VRRAKRGPDRVRKRVSGKRLPTDRSRLEQRQTDKRPVQPFRIRLDDAIAVECEPNDGELGATSGISKKLHQEIQASDIRRRSPRHKNMAARRFCDAPSCRDSRPL